MQEIRRWFRWFMLILVLHVSEQLLFGLDELYELSGQLTWIFGHLPNPDYGIVMMVGLVVLLVAALMYGQMTTGRARLLAPGFFGVAGLVEVHHLVKTVLHGYFPGAVTAVPFVFIGAGLLRAVIREARREAPAVASPAPTRSAKGAVVALLALVAAPVTARAQDVSYDYDKHADFPGYHTYAWTRGHELDDALNHKRIVAAVDSQMALKGLRQVDPSEHPDVLVAYHAALGKNLQVTGFANGWGGYRFAGNRSVSARTSEIVAGTLVADLIETTTPTIVWRGTATKEVDTQASPEKREKNINKAAEKLFKKYPPAK